MSRLRACSFPAVSVTVALLTALSASCEGALSPERTPQRAVIGFLKAVGRGDLAGAREWVAPESAEGIPEWTRHLFLPAHATPPTSEEENRIDQFIGLFYRITVREETETEARVHMVFVATDALVGFPSVADDPLVPNSASFMLTLKREGEAEQRSWRIVTLQPDAH